MSAERPLIILDTYVLAQNVRTGVYRVCDELYTRLIKSKRLNVNLFNRPQTSEAVKQYLLERGLSAPEHIVKPAHTDTCVFLSPFGVAPAKWLAAPNVMHVHFVYDLIGVHHPEFFDTNAAAEVSSIMRSLDEDTLIFVNSKSTKRDLLIHRPDLSSRQIIVVPLAAGPKFHPSDDPIRNTEVRLRYGIPLDVPYVLSLATLEIRKNLHQVIASFTNYLENKPDQPHHLVLSGMSGWRREQIDSALEKAGKWRSRIILTGFIDDEDLSPVYSGALCFVYLSRYEGFGLPLLEAMACGTPVISSNNSSLPEVVDDAGILLDADDIDGVADAIDRIESIPGFRDQISTAGLGRARMFSWDSCAEIVADALCTAHAEHKARLRVRRSRPLEPGAIVEQLRCLDGRLGANFQYYQNGSEGPRFLGRAKPQARATVDWPVWADHLPLASGIERPEGGLRLQGTFKTSTPDMPLVSYVTVVRNNAKGLARAIDSVQQQTYQNVEHIILDGASTDGTLKVLQSRAFEIDYYVSEPDAGLYHAMNKAIPLARGDLICVLNSDDWLERHAAEIAVERLPHASDLGLLLSAANVPGAKTEWYPAFVHPGCYFKLANDCHNAIYATRAAYMASGPYDTNYRIAADFKWIMTCLDVGVRFFYTRERTINYSLGGVSSDTSAHKAECIRIAHERFDALSDIEAAALHALFFVFGEATPHFASRAEQTQFLRDVFAAHSDQDELIEALSWAAIERMEFSGTTENFKTESSRKRLRRLRRAIKVRIKNFLWKRLYD